MNKRTSISKLLLSVSFLAIYCNVLFTQLLCNYSHISELFEKTDTHKDEHHHDEATPLAEHNHKHNDSKDDNCCKDKTSVFFAYQTNPSNTSFDFKNTFFTEFICFSNNIFINNHPLVNPKGYFSYESPPPKIPDIRVFTHSFII